MLEPARISTVVELITLCEDAWKSEKKTPADIIIHHHFRDHRFMGSKDRAAIGELTYFIIRHLSALQWWCMKFGLTSPRALVIAALILHRGSTVAEAKSLFDGERFSERPFDDEEEEFALEIRKAHLLDHDMPDDVKYNVPAWMMPYITSSLGDTWKEELLALNAEAPVDLRTNTLVTNRAALMAGLLEDGFKVEPSPHSPLGIRMQTRAPIFTSKHFKEGWFEMQDEGSQLVAAMLDAQPGERVIDFCAGAGGKTLAIAAQMQNKGRILAWDVSENRMKQMAERLKRARVDNVQRHVITSEQDPFLKRHKATANAVIVDAPCSGSGTWRRNPDLKWRSSESDLKEIILLQQKILLSASRLVKLGGRLLYITCSIFREENEQQIETFLSQAKNFKVVTESKICSKISQATMERNGMVRLTPHKDGTDGFFATLLQRVE